MWNFSGKTFLVTGANSGIGKQLTLKLVTLGARLFIIDKNQDQMVLVHNEFPHLVTHYVLDLTDIDGISQFMNSLRVKNVKLDGLVHCAGISPLMTLADFDFNLSLITYKINLFSFMAFSRFFMDERFTNEDSSIVGISSSTSVYGGNRQYIYSSTKSAMNLFVKSTAKELATRKIRINAVLPSITNTEMVAKLRTESDAIDMNVKYKQPLGIVQPDDVCNAILFLLSEQSNAISGTLMKVNNGESY